MDPTVIGKPLTNNGRTFTIAGVMPDNFRLAFPPDADVQDYDKIHNHILGLADLQSSGIEKQFPGKFSKS
jgi:hypothetical protein